MESLNVKSRRLLEPVNLHRQKLNGRYVYTFFRNGRVIELPTRWLRFLSFEPRNSEQTVYQYAANLKNLLVYFSLTEEYRHLPFDLVLQICTRHDLQHWIRFQNETNKSANTIHSREASVKEFFDWLGSKDGGNIRKPEKAIYKTGRLISPAPGKKAPRYLPAEGLILLLNNFHNEAERCMVHTMFDVGMRISEALRLRRCDLPDQRQYPEGAKYFPLRIEGAKGRGGRTKERISIISSPVLARILRYHNSFGYRFSPEFDSQDPDKPLFLSANNLPLSARNFNKQIKEAAKRAGLRAADFSAHKFRHGAAYSILKSELGKDYFDKMILVQQLFGHQQIRTTEIYASIPPALLQQLNNNETVVSKYEEAKRIFEATYLPPAKHIEKRGHR